MEEIGREICRMEWEARQRRREGTDDEGLEEIEAEARALGLPPAAIAKAMATAQDESEAERESGPVIDVWPESVPVLDLWFRLDHMWVYGPMGGRVCLRWNDVTARLHHIERAQCGRPIPSEHIEGLAVLERTLVQHQRIT